MNVVVINIDAMDKVKGSWPQYSFRKPKSLERLHRPKLCITASYAHGFCYTFYLSHDELTPHGASTYCDILSRTIEKIKRICRERNLQFPDQLILQSDNTPAQAKHSLTLILLAHLVCKSHFQICLLNFLVVGHTHEDVDRIFAFFIAWVLKRHRFVTPEELRTFTILGMAQHFADLGEEFDCEIFGHVFDFDHWLGAQGVHLYNAFIPRQGIDAPH